MRLTASGIFKRLICIVGPAINPFAFDQPVYSGDDVQVTCYVSKGDEPISVSWTLNGMPLTSGHNGVQLVNVGSKTSLLTLTNVNHNSDGEYRCLAHNPAGVASYSANLTVYGKGMRPLLTGNSSAQLRVVAALTLMERVPVDLQSLRLSFVSNCQSPRKSCRSRSATSRSLPAHPLTPSAP